MGGGSVRERFWDVFFWGFWFWVLIHRVLFFVCFGLGFGFWSFFLVLDGFGCLIKTQILGLNDWV